MDKLKWIDSGGGPLVLIADSNIKNWSGALNRSAYLQNKIEEANDCLNPEEADYGKACSINGYLGKVDIENDNALVLGDESMSATKFISVDGKNTLARWCYGDDEVFVDDYLQKLHLDTVKSWQDPVNFKISGNQQYLFDSAHCFADLSKEYGQHLLLHIEAGEYIIWTAVIDPDENTQLVLHKFESR
jgi:hypothetical protein